MKTATITWISYNNYGTSLQAYSLQKYLESLNISNEIINDEYIVNNIKSYTCDTDSNSRIHNIQQKNIHKDRIFRIIKKYAFHPISLIKTIVFRIQLKKRSKETNIYFSSQVIFEEFKKSHLKILSGIKNDNVYTLNDKYDTFICGSDQIWSVLDHNFKGYFYLDFTTKRKISYACSIGTTTINEEKKKLITQMLSSFSSLSVREKDTAIQLTDFLNRTVDFVADPTLLNTTDFWNNFSQKVTTTNRKYIICYFLNNNPWYFKYAKQLAKHLRKKLLLIPSREDYTHLKISYKNGVGPCEFVSLFKNADFVLTDSYHGSIFSIIFNKQFLYFKRFSDNDPISQNIRIDSLFNLLNIKYLIIDNKDFEARDLMPIDYRSINKTISDFRDYSRKFIKESLLDL